MMCKTASGPSNDTTHRVCVILANANNVHSRICFVSRVVTGERHRHRAADTINFNLDPLEWDKRHD